LEVVARAWRLEADSPAPPVDVAVAAEQPVALLAWTPEQAYSPDGWVGQPACLAALLADAPELPLDDCSPVGCSVAPLADGSALDGCYSVEPPADALAPRLAD